MRSPILLEDIEVSTGDFSQAITLPPDCYTSPEFFEFEREAVFAKEWLCLGRTDHIPNPGDFFTVTVIGEPLIVVRSREGNISVMSAVCRHRGMCITDPPQRQVEEWFSPPPETEGNCKHFRCPYHWWTYDLDGHLVGAPEMQRTQGFSRGDFRLPQLKVETWLGFIFASFNLDAEPLGPRLAELEALLANYRLAELSSTTMRASTEIPFNWKIMVENAADRYHADRLHAGIHNHARSADGFYRPFKPGDAYMCDRIKGPNPDVGSAANARAIFPRLPHITEEESWYAIYLFIPPSLFASVNSDCVSWMSIQPTGPKSHIQLRGLLTSSDTRNAPNFDALLRIRTEVMTNFNTQDLPVDCSVQRGLQSRFAPRGRISWQEEFLAQFNTWLFDLYRAEDLRTTDQSPVATSYH